MQLRLTLPPSLTDLEQATAGLPLLGYTVSWRCSGIEIAHDDLRRRLAAAGFAAAMPPPPTARTALRRALVAWIRARSSARGQPPLLPDWEELDDPAGGRAQRALIRVINRRGADWLAFVLVAEDVDLAALGLTHGTSLRILLEKASGRLVCTTDAAGEAGAVLESAQLEGELQPYWRRHRDLHVASDLSRVVRAIVGGLDAVSLRRGGGYYFVPVDRGGALGRLRRFVADLPVRAGHEPFLLALPQPDVNAARRQLARAAHAGFLDELAALDADLQRFLDAPPGTVRTGTIAQRLAAFRAFRERADAYALLLGMRQERIASALDELTAKARAVVLKGAAEPGADESSGDADQPPAPLADADAA